MKSIPKKNQVAGTSIESVTWNKNIYRNNEHTFRIVFPENWGYDNGTAALTLARAFNREKAIVISVGVNENTPVTKSPNNIFENVSLDETQKMIQNMVAQSNSKAKDLSFKKGTLNNYPAYIYEFKSNQSSGTKTFIYLTKQVQSMIHSKIYTITINLPIEEWNSNTSILFDRVVESFIFEIYN